MMIDRAHCPLCGGELVEYMSNRKECVIREKILLMNSREEFDCHYRIVFDSPVDHFYERFLVFPYCIESYEEKIFNIYKYGVKGPRFVAEVSGEEVFPWRDKEKVLKKLHIITVIS